MKRIPFLGSALVASLALTLLPVNAQSGGLYELSWSNVGAGGVSSGGVYALDSAVGQPDAGTLSGGQYKIDGGFIAGTTGVMRVYLPVVRK